MNSDLNIIKNCSENTAIKSIYVPFISFPKEEQKIAIENYISQQVDDFFKKISPCINKAQLSYSQMITDKDFNKIEISYFYENFFNDLEREPDNKLKLKIKWSITFDERCTPIKLAYLSPDYRGHEPKPKSLSYNDIKGRQHRKYGTIEINGFPIFYYIYFTLQEILDVVKEIRTF
ncbi:MULTISPECIES: hypothetical protein [Nostoc]|uniref:Uncharacterized protein n=1 Tax=Nostoc paludosum FACHB-159 TaxID=2692908 RepID=A0ABR8KB76_9NOSO|nr:MULTISPECIES: hypothetical protein [Nostoc]MBD2679842.1 hypothetical protein [Nostoc sp. FACHB-857]MBD2736091.1 hypothetical protein [Nostoc paludosum FACHB-159]